MKKILLFVVIALMLVQTVFAGSIVRTFSDVTIEGGDTISVTYVADGTAPFVKETIPSGWTVTSPAGGTVNNGVLRLQVSGSTTIGLKAPQTNGNYVFDGEYIIDGATTWTPFSSITVSVGEGGGCTPNWVCGEWGECIGAPGIKERTCNDGCGATRVEEDGCGVTPPGEGFCEYMEFAKFASEENYCIAGIVIILLGLFVVMSIFKK